SRAGTIKASEPPTVVITSNRTREIHDALKRRCLYYWVDYPNAERELAILRERLPDLSRQLARQVVAFVQRVRQEDVFKAPGIAESLDWATALAYLQARDLEADLVDTTLGALLKYQDDIELIRGDNSARLLAQVKADLAQL
ncbi:MAG: AAA family ATPase, partial [Pseudohongiellaceae bacterium]